NFRCKHCYNASGGDNCFMDNELTDDELLELTKDICNLKPYNICFCGGETLLRKKIVLSCATLLKEAGIPNIAIVTNGSLVTQDVAKELFKAGINRFQVSLDGKNASSHEALRLYPNSFEKAINAIKLFRELSEEVDVAFCPTSFNYNQLREVYQLVNTLKVKSLRIQPFMLSGRGMQNREIVPTVSQYRKLVSDINYIKRNEDYTKIDWGDPIDHIIRHRTLLKDFSNFVSIRSDGGLMASPYLPIQVGNIKCHSLSKYWRAGLYKVFSLDLVQDIATQVSSIQDMSKELKKGHIKWLNEDIEIDILDEYKHDILI
ncbi:TPA: radical SAM protein, partial [Enterococcus faecium]|nr:radical SAM protein [Enterococcus faecium]HAP9753886.1 radical SAM protein [Enterococcus faecium]HAQ2634000.1 radical SAM protein [Enterococcus faecium]HAQ4066699.1 radical SAM protein [Enterococcus faecium]HAQ4347883.1 radical SAM protein [Enterococcus faecium]